MSTKLTAFFFCRCFLLFNKTFIACISQLTLRNITKQRNIAKKSTCKLSKKMKKKTKNASMDVTDTESFLYKINLVKQKKKWKKSKWMQFTSKSFWGKKQKAWICTQKKKHITFSEEEKEKSVNMLTEDVEIFLNNFNSLRTCKKVFWFKKIVLFKQAWESFLGAR